MFGVWDFPRDVCLECGIFPVMCVWSVGFSQGCVFGVWDFPSDVCLECGIFPGMVLCLGFSRYCFLCAEVTCLPVTEPLVICTNDAKLSGEIYYFRV